MQAVLRIVASNRRIQCITILCSESEPTVSDQSGVLLNDERSNGELNSWGSIEIGHVLEGGSCRKQKLVSHIMEPRSRGG
jgi:hypothetical protein